MTRLSRRSVLGTCGGLLCTAASGCLLGGGPDPSPSENPDTARTYKYDSARSGSTAASLPGEGASERWSVRAPDVQNALYLWWATVTRDSVYASVRTFGEFPEAVLALDRETGEERWRRSPVRSVPAVVDGRLYLCDGRARALDPADGSELWTAEPGDVRGNPTVVDDRVYVRAGGTIHALDAADGSVVWSHDRNARPGASVSVADGTVYAGEASSDRPEEPPGVVAVDARTGDEVWHVPTAGVVVIPAVSGGTVYAIDHDGTIYAIDAAEGTVAWEREESPGRPASPSIADARLIVVRNREVVAHYAETGDPAWRRAVEWGEVPATVAGDVTLVADGNELLVLDTADGAERYTVPIGPDRRLTGIVAVDGTAYVGSTAGSARTFRIHAIGG